MSGFKAIEKACERLSRPVEVGILNNPKEASIGQLQHFGGTGYYQYGVHEGEEVDIPPRPFISAPVEHFGKEIIKMAADEYLDFSEKGVKNTLNAIGYTMVEDIKKWINTNGTYPPPNSERTVETKGFNHPLVDKGNLRDSIEYEVVEK